MFSVDPKSSTVMVKVTRQPLFPAASPEAFQQVNLFTVVMIYFVLIITTVFAVFFWGGVKTEWVFPGLSVLRKNNKMEVLSPEKWKYYPRKNKNKKR
jgi:hypothetical protein